MSIEVTMPRLSDTMESGTIVEWKVAVGDKVSSGDVVADVETDKATMELAVYDDGTIASIDVEPGQQVDVGTVIALLAEKGEDPANVKPSSAAPAPAPAPAATPEPAPAPVASPVAAPAAPASGGGMRISPVARRMAEAAGIPLATIVGTGPSGRIIKRDVEAAMAAGAETAASVPPAANVPAVAATPIAQPVAQAAPAAITPIESMAGHGSPMASRRVPLSNMRQVIARRLVESKTTIPHYQVSMSFDMDPLMTMRKDLNEKLAGGDVKLSVNDFLVRAAALAMHQHPDFNASFDGDAIVQHGAVNVGIAISLPEDKGGGLVVGVIRVAHDFCRVQSPCRKGSHSRPGTGRHGRRYLHHLQLGDVRRRAFHRHHQSPQQRDPRRRGSHEAAGGSGRFHRSWPSNDGNVVERPPGHRRRHGRPLVADGPRIRRAPNAAAGVISNLSSRRTANADRKACARFERSHGPCLPGS